MRSRKPLLVFSVSFLLIVILHSTAWAQYRAGLQGAVLDPQGSPVSGASVTLMDRETNQTRQTKTSDQGIYTFNGLAPAHYSLAVEMSGFKKKMLDDVTVTGEQMQSVNVQLDLGEVTESVTVSAASTPALDTETAEIAGTISAQDVQSLPSYGRDPFQLLRLAPGVFGDGSLNNNGGSQALPGNAGPGGSNATSSVFQTENQVQVAANGARDSSNSFEIDGVEVNSLAWGGAAVITPNEESVKEIKVVSNNYDAENGRNSGAQVLVVSQNGTNQYHGSAFFKADRPGLNAYQRWNGPNNVPVQRDNNRFNQFGGSVGGPVIHNKLFGFFSYETLRNNSISTSTGWYETPQFLKQAPAASIASKLLSYPGEGVSFNQIIPEPCSAAGLSPTYCQAITTGGAYAGLDVGSPLTTALGTSDPGWISGGTPGNGSGLDGIPDIMAVQTTDPVQNTLTQYNGRVDFQATGKDLIAFSGYYVPADSNFFNGQIRPADLWHDRRRNEAATALWDHTFTASLLNEARFSVSGWHYNEVQSNSQEPWGLPTDSIDVFGSINTLGSNNSANGLVFGAPGPGIFNQLTYNVRDTLTKVIRNHSLRIGGDIYKEQDEDAEAQQGRPSYNFHNVWDFLNDAPYSEFGNFNPATGAPTALTKYIRSNIYAFFVQDDYKVRPNLTLNLGVRWEYFGPIHEKYNNISNPVLGAFPDPLTGLSLKVGGNLYSSSKNNWGPQVGFAWSPTRYHDKTVIRGGFGIGYNHPQEAITLDTRSNPPLVASFNLQGTNILYGVPGDVHSFSGYPANPNAVETFGNSGLPVSGAPITLIAVPQDLATPSTYRYSLDLQEDLGHNWVAVIGYQGSATHHYGRTVNLNWLYAPLNPEVQTIYYHTDDANANYNALLAELRHHVSRTFEVDAQYTWSKNIDEGSNDYYTDQYPYSPSFARGPADFDATHNFKLWGAYTPKFFSGQRGWLDKVVGGWTLSGILDAHSGFPFTPIYGNTGCNLVYQNSGYCNLRPAAYLGGAGTDFSNATFMKANGNFSNGALAYFTVPAFTAGPAFPATGPIPSAPGVGRNTFRGPRYLDLDMTLGKAFGLPNMRALGENAKFEVRANFYNIFNKLNLTNVNNVISFDGTTSNSSFGQAQGALGGRVIEMQARFSF